METFIEKYQHTFNITPTKTIFEAWLSYQPDTPFNNIALFSRAMSRYGFVTKTKRIGRNVTRIYTLSSTWKPGTIQIMCSCGHTHAHTIDM